MVLAEANARGGREVRWDGGNRKEVGAVGQAGGAIQLPDINHPECQPQKLHRQKVHKWDAAQHHGGRATGSEIEGPRRLTCLR